MEMEKKTQEQRLVDNLSELHRLTENASLANKLAVTTLQVLITELLQTSVTFDAEELKTRLAQVDLIGIQFAALIKAMENQNLWLCTVALTQMKENGELEKLASEVALVEAEGTGKPN